MMTYRELVSKICEDSGIRREVVTKVLGSMTGNIAEALGRREKVQVRILGTFMMRRRAGRRGANPRTGEHMFIGEREIPGYRASPTLKKKLQETQSVRNYTLKSGD